MALKKQKTKAVSKEAGGRMRPSTAMTSTQPKLGLRKADALSKPVNVPTVRTGGLKKSESIMGNLADPKRTSPASRPKTSLMSPRTAPRTKKMFSVQKEATNYRGNISAATKSRLGK
jgi:hypothetical protein